MLENIDIFQISFTYHRGKIWKDLPENLKVVEIIVTFKNRINSITLPTDFHFFFSFILYILYICYKAWFYSTYVLYIVPIIINDMFSLLHRVARPYSLYISFFTHALALMVLCT